MEIKDALQLVIDTLQGVDIKATKDNMDKLLGSIQLLEKIRDDIVKRSEESEQEYEPPIEVEEIHG